MLVTADLYNEYLFLPNYSDYDPFMSTMGALITRTDQGWTLAGYNQVPTFLVSGARYFDIATATETRTFRNRQELLTSLQIGLSCADNSFLNVSNGITLSPPYYTEMTSIGVSCNHIPQLFARVKSQKNDYLMITAFSGEYSFKTKIFKGVLSCSDYRQLWGL